MATYGIKVKDENYGDVIIPYKDRLKMNVFTDNYNGQIKTSSSIFDLWGSARKSTEFNDFLVVKGDDFNLDVDLSAGRDRVVINGDSGTGVFDLGYSDDKLLIKGALNSGDFDMSNGNDKVIIYKKADYFSGKIELGIHDDLFILKANNASIELVTGSSNPFINDNLFPSSKEAGDLVKINGNNFNGSITGSEGNPDILLIKGDNFNGSINNFENGDSVIFHKSAQGGAVTLSNVNQANVYKKNHIEFSTIDSTLIGSKSSDTITIDHAENSIVDLGKGNDTLIIKNDTSSLYLKNIETVYVQDENGFFGQINSDKDTSVLFNDAKHELNLYDSNMNIHLGSMDSKVNIWSEFTGYISGDGKNVLTIQDSVSIEESTLEGFTYIKLGSSNSAYLNLNNLIFQEDFNTLTMEGFTGSELNDMSGWESDGIVGDGIDDAFYDVNDNQFVILDAIGNTFYGNTYTFA